MKVSSEELNKALEGLDMHQDPNLIYTDQIKDVQDHYIRLALETALKYKADAVYFRYIKSSKKYIPQIYIYDYTNENTSIDLDKDIVKNHRKLWNSGQVPLFFVFTKTEVKVFNSLKAPQKEGKNLVSKPIEIIQILSEVDNKIKSNKFKNFSAKLFSNGTFWDQSKYKSQFNIKDSAYEKLLQHLKVCRKRLVEKEVFLSKELTNKFILMVILIKYLEEREDDQGNKVFKQDFFKQFGDSSNFESVLRKGSSCLDLFSYLSEHFNGEIFEWTDEEKQILRRTNFTLVADFISSNTELTGQISFFELYSFNDLPVELISNIYEEFSSNSDTNTKEGVVYTPPYLVNFLLDECMPIYNPKENFKILDPACGSGIFLVSAFKRLVEWWRIKNDFLEPDLESLRKILLDNIYGVDIDPESVRVTIFSLSLAMCEFLSPKVIWEKLKFDNLNNKNLFSKDFFEIMYKNEIDQKFDLIIGNPPFVESLGEFGDKLEKLKSKEQIKIPGNQRALLFLEQSMNLCNKNALVCLILPSAPLLYNERSFEFRKAFFKKFHVPQVIDFSYLRSILFGEGGNVPVTALFVNNEKIRNSDLLHVVVKRTKASKEKLYFELDYYDFHYIKKETAINNRFVWKSNFLGGGRLLNIISRLSNHRNLGEYLQDKVKNHGWFVNEGFIEGKRTDILQDAINKNTLPTRAFTKNGIDKSKFLPLNVKAFKSPSNSKIFYSPHVLIKEIIEDNLIPTEFVDYDISFRDKVIGIHSPHDQKNDLKKIVSLIKDNKNVSFFVACTSSQFLITRATAILKKDINSIPFPEDLNELYFFELEEIIRDDTLDYISEFSRKGENAQIIAKTNINMLNDFSNIYCSILNSVYKENNNEFKTLKFIQKDSFVICSFFYGSEKPEIDFDLDNIEKYVNRLIENKLHENLKINRVLRVYDNNIIFLIKPNQQRYWLRSIGIRDADETFLDLYKQGF